LRRPGGFPQPGFAPVSAATPGKLRPRGIGGSEPLFQENEQKRRWKTAAVTSYPPDVIHSFKKVTFAMAKFLRDESSFAK
jgi:hypothetical protein